MWCGFSLFNWESAQFWSLMMTADTESHEAAVWSIWRWKEKEHHLRLWFWSKVDWWQWRKSVSHREEGPFVSRGIITWGKEEVFLGESLGGREYLWVSLSLHQHPFSFPCLQKMSGERNQQHKYFNDDDIPLFPCDLYSTEQLPWLLEHSFCSFNSFKSIVLRIETWRVAWWLTLHLNGEEKNISKRFRKRSFPCEVSKKKIAWNQRLSFTATRFFVVQIFYDTFSTSKNR